MRIILTCIRVSVKDGIDAGPRAQWAHRMLDYASPFARLSAMPTRDSSAVSGADRAPLVLTATKRLARGLLAEHTAAQIAAGRAAWEQPRIMPWSAWVQSQIEWLLDQGHLQRYPLVPEQERLLWQQVTNDSSSGNTGSTVFDFEGDGPVEAVYADEYHLHIYRGADGFELPARLAGTLPLVHRLLLNKYWIDEIYGATFIAGTIKLSRFLWEVDARVVDGAVNLVARIYDVASRTFRRLQVGFAQGYAMVMFLGAAVLLGVFYLIKL